jgi:hypothetical protein
MRTPNRYHPHPDLQPRPHETLPDWMYEMDLVCPDCGACPHDDCSVVCPRYWTARLDEGICAVLGHDLTDKGHAGPESGTEAHYCIRCPYSWHHVWY